MKFAVATLLTALLGFVAPLFLPWWTFAITSLIIAYTIHQKPVWGGLAGFTGLFLVWGVYAWMLDRDNNHILSQKIGPLLSLGQSSILLVIVTGLVGGLVSGLAALAGSFARK
jgi:hypothetical protein